MEKKILSFLFNKNGYGFYIKIQSHWIHVQQQSLTSLASLSVIELITKKMPAVST